MELMDLATELLAAIASSIETDHDLNCFARTSRRLYSIANEVLFRRDARRENGETSRAMAWAARRDKDDTARRSLEAGLSPSSGLVEAARRGSEKVVELLVGWEGVDPNVVGNGDNRRTALSYAAEMGHLGVVGLLLAVGEVDPDSRDSWGNTPLGYAAGTGHLAVVERLLRMHPRVLLDNRYYAGYTALWEAAANGHADVVELLLSHGADPNVVDEEDNTTPLGAAARALRCIWDSGPTESEPRYMRTVEVLLRHPETDVNLYDRPVRVLFDWCAQDGHETIFGLLLAKRKDFPANPPAGAIWDLLRFVAMNDNTDGIIRMMVAEDGVDPDRHDSEGRTPLSYAAEGGRWRSVKALLDTARVDVNSKDHGGHTPLYWAVMWGSEETVDLLLAHGASTLPKIHDSEVLDELLIDAAESDNPWPIKMFWDPSQRDINDIRGEHERTLLSLAAADGGERVVQFLLKETNIELNAQDDAGRTALWFAAHYCHQGVIKMLLAEDKIDISIRDHSNESAALTEAVENMTTYEDEFSSVSSVELLLSHPAADTSCISEYELLRGLERAATNGFAKVVELLILKDDRIHCGTEMETGQTLLSWAKEKNKTMAKLLLEKEELRKDPTAKRSLGTAT